MTPKQFALYMERDGGCVHCGEQEAVSPNHRVNRGMGGSRLRDRPSNVVVLCSALNSLIESDARWASLAKDHGWKLESWQVPEDCPVYIGGQWWLLDNDFGMQLFDNSVA